MDTYRFESVGEIPGDFDQIFRDSARRSVFLSRPWFENFERTVLEDTDQEAVFAAMPGSADAPPGLLLCWSPGPEHGLGPHLRGLSNFYSSLHGPVIAWPHPGAQRTVDALVAALISDPRMGHRFEFAPLPIEDGVLECLEGAFRRSGWWVRRYFCFGNWYLPCGGMSFEDYLATRPSRVRNTLRRKRKQFERLDDARMEIVCEWPGLEKAIDAFNAVYATSWKKPEPYPEFIRGLVRTLASAPESQVRMGVAWLGDKPIAAQIWFICGGVASIFKLAYDETHRSLSAGTLLTEGLLRHVLDVDHVREVDYLTGDDPYKQEWMTKRRERWGLAAFNPGTPRGFFEGGMNRLGAWWRARRD